MSSGNFTTDGWSYDPTCKPSPSGAHYWILTSQGAGICRHCDMENFFQVALTNGLRPVTKAYSIRGGESTAKRSK